MKKIGLLLLIFSALSYTSYARTTYPFTVLTHGNGMKAVLFIPGFSCSGEVWDETITHLAPQFKCYVLTMPGFAGIPAQTEPDIKSWVDNIAIYIKEEKLDKPVIIGHSLGGLMAQWLAADYPDLVSKIVVVDALPCLNALSQPDFKPQSHPDCTQFVTYFKGMDEKKFYQMQKIGMATMVADTSKIEKIVSWSVASDRNTLGQIYCQLLNTDLREKIKSVKCPALVLLEANFKGLNAQIALQYMNLKNVKLVYAGKGLHFIMYDDKEWYFQELKLFLN
jgi:pimeloyl-ACP methyl ester carboxylesterase